MPSLAPAVSYKSPLHKMTQTTPTCLWNDSASIEDLTYSIEHGAVGATCNPSIAVAVLKQELAAWKPRPHRGRNPVLVSRNQTVSISAARAAD